MRLLHKIGISRAQAAITEFFGLGSTMATMSVIVVAFGLIFGIFWFFHSAPPDTIVITSGPEGSIAYNNAEKYAKILARKGVKLKILPSEGSLENLKRLTDPRFHADIGFIQGGVNAGIKTYDKLVSLGSISYQPMLVFYRNAVPVDLLSELEGKRLAIGPEGSGTRTLALSLLAANGIEPGGTTILSDLEADAATKALLEEKVDAVFLMGDSASVQNIRTLLRTPGIHLMDFTQAEGYTRRIAYLNKLILPKGSIDFGKDIPPNDVHLIAPTVELIARSNLHPALSDLLIEAAQEVHGGSGLLKHKDEFPTPLSYEFSISDDASRYYKSGKSFLYRYLPFWMASLVNRFLVVFVPLMVLLIPAVKMVPAIYKWRISMGIYRWYRVMLAIEQDLLADVSGEKQQELLARLDRIQQAVNGMKVPASFAEQFYVLRGHIDYVRARLKSRTVEAPKN